MFDDFKGNWKKLWEAPPGSRFRDHYHQRQESRPNIFIKLLFIGGGLLIVGAGIFLLPAPGPGTVVIIIGLGLIAQESFYMARVLDWLEPYVRKLVAFIKNKWEDISLFAQILLVILAMLAAGAIGFAAYQIFMQ